MCPAWNPKPAQGPVRSMRSWGSISLMLQSHPCRGSQRGGKSRARGPAIAMQSRQSQRWTDTAFRIMYIMFKMALGLARLLPSPKAPTLAWSLITGASKMRARERCRNCGPPRCGPATHWEAAIQGTDSVRRRAARGSPTNAGAETTPERLKRFRRNVAPTPRLHRTPG